MARKKRDTIPRPVVSPVGGVYTSEEAAEILRTSRRTVQRLIRQGQLKANRLGHGYRILDKYIQEFFAQQDQPVDNYSHATKDPGVLTHVPGAPRV